jgi:hypothetical protein
VLAPELDEKAKLDADADADAEDLPLAVALPEELEKLTEPAIASLAPSIRAESNRLQFDRRSGFRHVRWLF